MLSRFFRKTHWHVLEFCSHCDHVLTWDDIFTTECCPYCGHVHKHNLPDRYKKAGRWVRNNLPWWQALYGDELFYWEWKDGSWNME